MYHSHHVTRDPAGAPCTAPRSGSREPRSTLSELCDAARWTKPRRKFPSEHFFQTREARTRTRVVAQRGDKARHMVERDISMSNDFALSDSSTQRLVPFGVPIRAPRSSGRRDRRYKLVLEVKIQNVFTRRRTSWSFCTRLR